MNIHPTALLLAWIAFAAAMPWLDAPALAAASVMSGWGVWLAGFEACWPLLRRTRVLLIALVTLYALATPGAPLIPGWTLPTYEGVQAGMMQAWRLLLMIVALALILTRLAREQWLAGIYGLLLPFKPLGLPLDRIAVRLWLTLHYAETGLQGQRLRDRWQEALAVPDAPASSVMLDMPAAGLRDLLFVLGVGVLLLGALAC